MTRLAILVLGIACAGWIGCAGVRAPSTSLVLEDEGALSLYLAPLPPEATRSALRFSRIAAKRDDGTMQPLTLTTLVGSSPASRERLVASGSLPQGRYVGLEVAIESSEGARSVDVSFEVQQRRALVLTLSLDARRSIGEDFVFHPEFTAAIPDRLPAGLIALASAQGSNAVVQFDKRSGHVVQTIATGKAPRGLVVDQARRRAYVACSGDDSVEVIDLIEGRVIERLTLIGGDSPEELVLSSDGNTLLSANAGSNTVSIIDARSLLETGRLNVGEGPHDLVIDPTGRRAFVFNGAGNDISVIDIPRAAVARSIVTEANPFRGEFNRRGDRLYVVHRASPYVTVLDTNSLTVLRRVYVGSEVTALKVDLQTDRFFIARRNADAIDLYDPQSFLPVDNIRVSQDIGFMAIDGESNSLLLVLPREGQVQIVPLVSKRASATIDVGIEPYAIVVAGER
ncbi:MAG: beta-propeller fold lactonase family protein [Acidobacteriota bacterium]